MSKNNTNTCFLSPHSDDIVMAGYKVIADKIFPGCQLLLTAFGISNYVEKIKRNEFGSSTEVITETRLLEDKAFAKVMGMSFKSLQFSDCLLRYGEVFFDPERELNTLELEKLTSAIKKVIVEKEVNTLIVPFPTGSKQHYDHRLLFAAATQLAGQMPIDIYYLDDVPYSRIKASRNMKKVLITLNSIDLEHKHQVMNIYRSQMCSLYHNQVDFLAKKNHMTERIFKDVTRHYRYTDLQQRTICGQMH